ncbi:hypothetical protein ACMGER_11580 [Sphingomonas sp. DT-204]
MQASSGIDVRAARLADVIDTYYRVMSNSPYVICPSVTGALGKVSVRAPSSMTRQALQTLLRVNGFSLRREKGIDVVCDLEQPKVASVTPGTIEPYGPPEGFVPQGNPLSPPASGVSPLIVEGPTPASSAPTEAAPADRARLVYRVRHRASEELLAVLQSAGIGTFTSVGVGTARVDGASSSTLGGQSGDLILWTGNKDDRDAAREILEQVDQPLARAYVEIAAVAVGDVQTSSRSLSIVGDALGIGASLGSAGGGLSIDVGGLSVNFDALETSRQLRVVKRWSGYITSGRDIESKNGGSVPVISALTESSTGRVTQAVSYQPTGLTMRVRPTVLDNVVRLAVDLQDQSVAGGTSTAPVFETRSLTGEMEVCFGCVSVISNLDDQATDRTKDTFLGFIPLGSSKHRHRIKLIYIAYVRAKHEAPHSPSWGHVRYAVYPRL